MALKPPEGDPHRDRKDEIIHVFTSHESANLAAANLQANGIHCWITSDDGGGMLPNFAGPEGVRLHVRALDAGAAIALLTGQAPAEEISAPPETEASLPSPDVAAPQKKFSPVQIVLGMIAGVLLCLFYQWGTQLGTRTYYYYTRSGKTNKAWIYRNGHPVEFLKDRNLDGSWDEWDYYEHGQVMRAEFDNNFDGKSDVTWTYSNDTPIKIERDTDFNGTPDEFGTYKNGMMQQVDIRPNGAKFATQRLLYQNGVMVKILRAPDASGDFKEAVMYDPFFNPISTNKLE